ncbi:NH3-dependent NAD+ synthetase [Bacillus thermophilus]|uniref:NH3-dependent NAD+ synthetase n=1 Tax=Siminovitchia thermophila TaxID=1245522 RepID=A0ABS2R2N6_9BACI|nr:NH3-dependent NAD+ synthetase [Siminovitchia thermophila]
MILYTRKSKYSKIVVGGGRANENGTGFTTETDA